MAQVNSKKKNTKKKAKVKQSKGFWTDKNLWLPAIALMVLTFLVFSPSLNNGFVNWDDDINILENASVLNFDLQGIFSASVIGGYNPLTTLVFAIENAAFGLNPTMFHLVNVLLHVLCTFFVYRFLLLLGLSRNAALFGAALFGIHPMRVESVTWITELKDVLFGVFYLAALVLYTKAIKEKKAVPHLLIVPLFILSLFSKIQAVSLPLSMLAVDYYFNRPIELKRFFEKAHYFLLSLAVGVLGIVMLSSAETLNDDNYFSFFDRILIGLYSIGVYLVKFLVPYLMAPLYPYPYPLPVQVYITPVIIAALLFLVYRAYRKEQRAVVFAAAFFIVNIVFLLQVLGAGQGYLADRFTYIPYIGFFFLLAYGFDFLIKNKPAAKSFLPYVAAAYVAVMGFVTVNQIGIWKDSESLWLHVIKHYDQIQRPYGNLAHHYREKGRYDDAIAMYTRGISKEANGTIYNGRGKAYFDKAIRANPQQPPRELVNKAIADYTSGLQLDGDMAELRINRGAAYASQGQYPQAIEDLTIGLQQNPENPNGYFNRSLVYNITGKYEEAIADHTKYLSMRPNNPDIYYERGLANYKLNRFQEAVNDYSKAIQLNANKAYYMERSRAYKGLGEVAKSNADYESAQQLR